MKPLFKTNSFLGLRAVFLLLLAALLVFFDQNNNLWFQRHLKVTRSALVTPIYVVVNKPVKWFAFFSGELARRQKLLAENMRLRSEVLLLHNKLQELTTLKAENERLQQLLQSASKKNWLVSQVQLLAVVPNPFVQQLVLNKGKKDHVFVGQAVIDGYGLMGQIIKVESSSSRLMLITDRASTVPIQDRRSGIRALAVGAGITETLNLQGVAQTADIKVGDVLITSGLGQHYQYGYPVAKVSNIQRGGAFLKVQLQPIAHINRSRLMLLVWSQKKKTLSTPPTNIHPAAGNKAVKTSQTLKTSSTEDQP